MLANLSATGSVAAQTNQKSADQTEQTTGQTEQPANPTAQQEDENSDLPTNAKWRYGETGKLKRINGYFRIKFSPDGKLLAARNQQNLLSLIDAETQQTLFEFKVYEDRQWIQNIDFSPDSKFVLAATQGTNEKISVWNTATGELYRELEIDGKAAFFRTEDEICVLQDKVVLVYSLQTGKQISSKEWGRTGDLPLTCSRDGLTVVFSRRSNGRNQFSVFVADLKNKTSASVWQSVAMPRRVTLSEDGNWLATTFMRSKDVRILDLREPAESDTLLRVHKDNAESVCFSPDSRFLATTGWDSQVQIWDMLSGRRLDNLVGHSGHVTASGFSPNDFTIATGANGRNDCSILVWDFRSLVFQEPGPDAPVEFDDIWKALGERGPKQPLQAVSVLINQPGLFEDRIAEALGLTTFDNNSDMINKWIEQLSSPRYADRSKAEKLLRNSRLRAEPQLQAMLKRQDIALEVRVRIARIMHLPIERPKINDTNLRRLHRVIYAMELCGGEKAQKILQNLAESHEHIDVARDAYSSLDRCKANQELETKE